MKRSMFLSTILCLGLICSNQKLNSINLPNNDVSGELIIGGLALSLITYLYNIRPIIGCECCDPEGFKRQEEDAKKHKISKKAKTAIITGLIISGIGIYRSLNNKN